MGCLNSKPDADKPPKVKELPDATEQSAEVDESQKSGGHGGGGRYVPDPTKPERQLSASSANGRPVSPSDLRTSIPHESKLSSLTKYRSSLKSAMITRYNFKAAS